MTDDELKGIIERGCPVCRKDPKMVIQYPEGHFWEGDRKPYCAEHGEKRIGEFPDARIIWLEGYETAQ